MDKREEQVRQFECPPVMICGFNRPRSLKMVFEAVRAARPKQLFLVLDVPREGRLTDGVGYDACREIFDQVDWPCDVKRNYAESNMGCGKRMTSGITWTFQHVDRAIILEDDCVPAPTFFRFCGELLERYKDDSRVGMIAGHDEHLYLDKIPTNGYSYYFDRMVCVWGWATWKRAWSKHDPTMSDWPELSSSGVVKNLLTHRRHYESWLKSAGGLYSGHRKTWAGKWACTMYREGWLSVHPFANQITNVGSASSRAEAVPRASCAKSPSADSWMNRPTKPIDFPLQHPLSMLPNLTCEYWFLESIYCAAWWRKAMRIPGRVRRKGVRLLKDLVPSHIKSSLASLYRKYLQPLPSFCVPPTESGVVATPRSPQVIVTLTSFPARIGAVHATIWTLLRQSFKPDKVILWLAREQFPGGDASLPDSLLTLREFGLTIEWCEDIGSYKKLVPCLRKYPKDILVTADDDILYPPNWLERLYNAYQEAPQFIHAHRVHRIRFDKTGEMLPYLLGDGNPVLPSVYFKNLPTTGGGVLYPPGSLDQTVTDASLFMRLSPKADDIWFWAMAVKKGAKISGLQRDRMDCYWNYRADGGVSLASINNGVENLNDKQMLAVIERFPEILNLLER